MKRILPIFISILFLYGCKYKVDKTDIFKVGDAIHKSFLKGDMEILKQIYQSNMNHISETNKNEIKKIQSFYKNTTKVLKMDTSSMDYAHFLDMFYKRDTLFYRLRSSYIKDPFNNISIIGFSFDNMTELCEKDQKEIFCPSSVLLIKNINWWPDYSRKYFKKGSVLIQNFSVWDFNYVKFRVTLKRKISPTSFETFFNQTVEINKKIHCCGDEVWVDIDEMNDYYAGFPLSGDIISFTAELIEAGPKPESEWCITIEKLKSIQVNKISNKKL